TPISMQRAHPEKAAHRLPSPTPVESAPAFHHPAPRPKTRATSPTPSSTLCSPSATRSSPSASPASKSTSSSNNSSPNQPTRSCKSPTDFPTPTHRSEEHTSELQSRENLVCRLLLEKKKII